MSILTTFGRKSLATILPIMFIVLTACSTGTSVPPTVTEPSNTTSAVTAPTSAPTSSAANSGSVSSAANGSLLSALDHLNKATSFHFAFTINGKNPVEGDSSGLQGNFHFTTSAGEWLSTSGSKGATYQNQGGKWVVDSSGFNGLDYTTVIALIGYDAGLPPSAWQASGTQKIGGQEADYYVHTGPHGVNIEKEEAWVNHSSGDIVQLQETITFKSTGTVSTVTVMTINKIDQPVTIPSP